MAVSRGDADGAVRSLQQVFAADMLYYHSWGWPDDNLALHNRPEFELIRDDPAFQRLLEPR